jgi:hypothetical protein
LQAVFRLSQNSPSEVVPSPVVTKTTSSPFARCLDRAASSPSSSARARRPPRCRPPAGTAFPSARRWRRCSDRAAAPVRRHLPAAGHRVRRRADRLEHLLQRGHPELPARRRGPGSRSRTSRSPGARARRPPPGSPRARAGDLEEDLVLPLELDLLVVQPRESSIVRYVTRKAETRGQYRGAPFAQARSYRAYAKRARWPRSGHAPEAAFPLVTLRLRTRFRKRAARQQGVAVGDVVEDGGQHHRRLLHVVLHQIVRTIEVGVVRAAVVVQPVLDELEGR